MRVAYWRDGGEPRPTRIAIIAPCHRFQRAGINTCTVVADGLLPIGVSTHLRFSFKPIVTIARVSSVAGSVKLVGTLPNALRKLVDRFKEFHVLSVLLFHSGVSPSP